MTARLVLLALLAAPAAVADPLSPGEFEALAEGHVLRFSLGGMPYGAEQYFPGRRTLWASAGGGCLAGVWWPDGDDICFRYEGEAGPGQCWRFLARPDGFAAERVEAGEPTGLVLDLSGRSEAPLACPGPDVGS